ncbi:MAG: TIGR01906 family membrane protein [Firmicutes bacterium]|nr:TIGR01906 family membrane protein [Bacillota bacterium]
MKQSKSLFLILTVATMLLVFTASVAVPLLCRPFYYAHVEVMELAEGRNWTEEQCREAYDEVMNYCLFGGEFSTGVFPWSRDGKDHFDDCVVLFRLNFLVLLLSALVVLSSFFLRRKGYFPARPLGLGAPFWSGASLLTIAGITAILTAMDFDRAFVVFHHLFFPGETNWFFDYKTDPIILILPEAFFRNCAILIGSVMVTACVAMVILDIVKRKK